MPWRLAPSDGVQRYTYVRALAKSEETVHFTVLSVEAGRVISRIHFAADLHALDSTNTGADVLRTLWAESEASVGEHGDAFAPLTIEELYEACKSLVEGISRENPAHLYFHPNGILMHCGSSTGGSDSVSIQSFSRFGLKLTSHQEREECGHLVCVNQRGAYAPFAETPLTDDECLPSTLGRRLSRQTKAWRDVACQYPGLCPRPKPPQPARWVHPRRACQGWRAREPGFLELGKPEPLQTWSFPFETAVSVECGRVRRVYLRRVEPFGSQWRQ